MTAQRLSDLIRLALLAYSGHTPVVSLARYARVSPKALRRWQAARDPAHGVGSRQNPRLGR